MLTATELREALESGAVLLDLRPAPQFATRHAAGAINIPFSERGLARRVDAIVPARQPVVLLASEREGQAAATQLSEGDRVTLGWADGEDRLWESAGLANDSLPLMQTEELADDAAVCPYAVLDVREPVEWETGHVPGAILIPLGDLRDRNAELPRGRMIAVICEAGVRSSTAASLLRTLGHRNVASVVDGTAGYRSHEHPLEYPPAAPEQTP